MMIVQAQTPKNLRWSGLTPALDFSSVLTVQSAMLTTIKNVINSLPGFLLVTDLLLQAI